MIPTTFPTYQDSSGDSSGYLLSYTCHIWVIPMARTSVLLEYILVISVYVDNCQHTIPAVFYVMSVSPQVAVLCYDTVDWLETDRAVDIHKVAY